MTIEITKNTTNSESSIDSEKVPILEIVNKALGIETWWSEFEFVTPPYMKETPEQKKIRRTKELNDAFEEMKNGLGVGESDRTKREKKRDGQRWEIVLDMDVDNFTATLSSFWEKTFMKYDPEKETWEISFESKFDNVESFGKTFDKPLDAMKFTNIVNALTYDYKTIASNHISPPTLFYEKGNIDVRTYKGTTTILADVEWKFNMSKEEAEYFVSKLEIRFKFWKEE